MSSTEPENYMFTSSGWLSMPTPQISDQIMDWRNDAITRNNNRVTARFFMFNYPDTRIDGNLIKYEILFGINHDITYERISICNTLMWHDIRFGVHPPTENGTYGQYEEGYTI